MTNSNMLAAHVASALQRFLRAKKVKATVVALKDSASTGNGPQLWPHDASRFALTWTRNPREGWVIDVAAYELHSERQNANRLISATCEATGVELLNVIYELNAITSLCEDVGIDLAVHYLEAHVRAAEETQRKALVFGT